jgi:serine/threonine protein kinase
MSTVVHGRYKVLSLLGQGGMGAVYLVEDQKVFGKRWALKELLDTFTDPVDRAQAVQQFEQEAKMLVSLSHPNLPQVADYFSEGGRQYLVMEYVEGETLEGILQKVSGFLPEAHVVDWAVQICGVLEYLHNQKPKPIIFRDLKPANVMLAKDGKIKLIDFGIARLFDPAKKTDTIKMGTAGYAPPEQYAGRGQTDARSDVYALGATLHHLLTKRDPSSQPFIFPACQNLNSGVSDLVAGIVSKATNVDPDRRYQSAAEMKQALLGLPSVSPASAQPLSASIVGLDPVQWIQTSPLPMFLAYCTRDQRETTWVQDADGSCTCLECDQSWPTEDLEAILRAHCKRCNTQTTWAISWSTCVCLGCGQVWDVDGVTGAFEAYCSTCKTKTPWVVHSEGRTCLGCGQQR